ncbi:zinc finger protein 501-like [Armigeres subalbatus]|uniref:zinc finger protein 501-like n=1 Tax=Armigeres subalbatus TaxID=124917 RepID=UPI002ED5892F
MEVERLCRLCLQEGPDNVYSRNIESGNAEESSETSIEQLVLQYLPIQIFKTEDCSYPYICIVCKNQIKQWHRFYITCVNNNEIYQLRILELFGGTHDAQPEVSFTLKEESTDNICKSWNLDQTLKFETVEVRTLPINELSYTEPEEPPKRKRGRPRLNTSEKKTELSTAKKRGPPTLKLKKKKLSPSSDKKRGRPKINHEPKKYKPRPKMCPICGKFFTVLREHIRNHNNDRKYQCSYCAKTFIGRSNFFTHVNIHTRTKWYKCKLCDKQYIYVKSLKQHMAIHTGERKYICTICNKSYRQMTSLARHKRNHFEEPQIKCSECDHLFYTNGELNKHFKKHLPDRPFACEICGRAFYRKCNLRTHMKIHLPKTKSGSKADKKSPDGAVSDEEITDYDT